MRLHMISQMENRMTDAKKRRKAFLDDIAETIANGVVEQLVDQRTLQMLGVPKAFVLMIARRDIIMLTQMFYVIRDHIQKHKHLDDEVSQATCDAIQYILTEGKILTEAETYAMLDALKFVADQEDASRNSLLLS